MALDVHHWSNIASIRLSSCFIKILVTIFDTNDTGFILKVVSFDFAFPMSGYIVIHVAIEKGTETESRPKMSVICESIFQIEKAK